MHQNRFLTSPDVEIIFFKDLILVVTKCIKTRFQPLQTLKNMFFKDLILVAWKCKKNVFNHSRRSGGLEMHQNTCLTTPDVKT